MSSDHTPGRMVPNDIWGAISDAANRRRILALWNAAIDLPTETLEAIAAESDAIHRNAALSIAAERHWLAASWSLADEAGEITLGPAAEAEHDPVLPSEGDAVAAEMAAVFEPRVEMEDLEQAAWDEDVAELYHMEPPC